MGLSLWQLLLVAVLFLLLFGRGKIPALMTDLAAGIKNFKSGIKDDEDIEETANKKLITGDPAQQRADTGRVRKPAEAE